MPWPTPMHMVARRAARAAVLQLQGAVRASRAPLAPERVAERDRPAVGVDVLGVVGQAEQPQDGQRLARRPRSARRHRCPRYRARPGRAACGWPGSGRCPSPAAARRPRRQHVTRASGSRPYRGDRALGRDEQRRRAVVDPGRVPAVTRAAGRERRQLRQRLQDRRPRVLVDLDTGPARLAAAGPAPARSPGRAGRGRCARAACCWERSANASWSSRDTPCSLGDVLRGLGHRSVPWSAASAG